MTRHSTLGLAAPIIALSLSLGVACDQKTEAPEAKKEAVEAPKVEKKKLGEPVQEALVGGPYPSLLVSQAWFYKNEAGKTTPGPARLQIWRDTPKGWETTTLEDGDSNVFHKAMPYEGGILTIGAEKALLKHWTFKGGKWSAETLWEKSWGGRFDRLRDIEVGDVDGDGKDELVLATHDSGVVAVINPDEADRGVIEMDMKADTFVHEIEIGDIDGDGKMEFFATPTDRNKVGTSQKGSVVMYRWDGAQYKRTVVDPMGETHAKEILCDDLDGDGTSELFSVLEAELGEDKSIKSPVEIRQYTLNKAGKFDHKVIATIQDKQTRFLVPADVDKDGQKELIAAAMTSGLWLLDKQGDGTWSQSNFEKNSSGFEHTTYAADLNEDGTIELYVAADKQGQLRSYEYDAEGKRFRRKTIGKIPERTITWNITTGKF